MLPQFRRERTWRQPAFESGLQLAVWGLFKKIVIADNLAPFVNVVYDDPTAFAGKALVTATIFFAFQIYCDFSGYTDMARGVARMLGFELIKNFDYPYFSRTPVEFWRRWHISLSQWFQDYLYYPLAMRYMRQGRLGEQVQGAHRRHDVDRFLARRELDFHCLRTVLGYRNCASIFTARIAWPSANSPGPLQRTSTAFPAAGRIAIACVAMFTVACIGWVFFRAASIDDAWHVLSHAFSATGESTVTAGRRGTRVDPVDAVAGLWIAEWLYRNRPRLFAGLNSGQIRGIAWRSALIAAILFSYIVAQEGVVQPFIYFQF